MFGYEKYVRSFEVMLAGSCKFLCLLFPGQIPDYYPGQWVKISVKTILYYCDKMFTQMVEKAQYDMCGQLVVVINIVTTCRGQASPTKKELLWLILNELLVQACFHDELDFKAFTWYISMRQGM